MKKLIIVIFMIILSVNTAKAETINWETTRDKIISNSYDVQLSQVDIDISKAKMTIMNLNLYYLKLKMLL